MTKDEFIKFIKEQFQAKELNYDEASHRISQNFPDYEPLEFRDFYMFNKEYMTYIIGFSYLETGILFYTDGRCIEGYSIFIVNTFTIIDNKKIDLLEKRKKELEEVINFVKKEFAKREIELDQYKNI